jgi:hypothetical protein
MLRAAGAPGVAIAGGNAGVDADYRQVTFPAASGSGIVGGGDLSDRATGSVAPPVAQVANTPVANTPVANTGAYAAGRMTAFKRLPRRQLYPRTGAELKELFERYFHTVLLFSLIDETSRPGITRGAQYLFAVCYGKKN